MNEENIATEIVVLRGRYGLSQQGLADKLGISQRTVASWESGLSLPRKAMRVKIAEAFDLPANYFFEDKSSTTTVNDLAYQEMNSIKARLQEMLDESQYLSDDQKKSLMSDFTENIRMK